MAAPVTYANFILILSLNMRASFLLRYGLVYTDYPPMYILACGHSQTIDYFNIKYFPVVAYWQTTWWGWWWGETWEQKIVEDNWSVVTTFRCQLTKKSNWVFLKSTLVSKKAIYSYQVSLTSISIYSFISKAIKLLFIYLVSLSFRNRFNGMIFFF